MKTEKSKEGLNDLIQTIENQPTEPPSPDKRSLEEPTPTKTTAGKKSESRLPLGSPEKSRQTNKFINPRAQSGRRFMQQQQPEQKQIELTDLEIKKSLGKGSFGRVKLVKLKGSKQYYAMKCLAKDQIKGKKHIQHILNEKAILQKFGPKDFCCNIHSSFQDASNLYMLLDFLPGGELFKQIKKEMCLSVEASRFYVAEIVLAIETLHSMNIIWRDLKPENILLDKEGHVKLIDFGFAKVLKNIHKDRAFTNCGTPGYCAPEVMLDAGHTYKADIWSLGILICELIGGFTPFQGKDEANNPKAIMEKVRSGNLNLPKNLTGNSRDLVKLLLVDDPNGRLETSQIKQHKFFKGLNWTQLKERNTQAPFIPEAYRSFSDRLFPEEHQEEDSEMEQDQYVTGCVGDQPNSAGVPRLNEEQSTPEKVNKNLRQIVNQNSFSSSKKYSATGGTGGYLAYTNESAETALQQQPPKKNPPPSKVLGDYHMSMINKAFKDF